MPLTVHWVQTVQGGQLRNFADRPTSCRRRDRRESRVERRRSKTRGISFLLNIIIMPRASPFFALAYMIVLTISAHAVGRCEMRMPGGPIDGCCRDAASTDAANSRTILPLLNALAPRTYFRYFKVALWRSCPFWPDDGMCALRDCAVCECDPREIPTCWEESSSSPERGDVTPMPTGVDSPVSFSNVSGDFSGWSVEGGGGGGASGGATHDTSRVWSVEGMEGGGDAQDAPVYVNLLSNPESYTGYAGNDAARAWAALHGASCLSSERDVSAAKMCASEEKAFERLLSGLQASINTHISLTYNGGRGILGGAAATPSSAFSAPLSSTTLTASSASSSSLERTPSPAEENSQLPASANVSMYVDRVGRWPDRLSALYFTYLFVARAVAKAAPALRSLELVTGDPAGDARTRELLDALLISASSPGGVGAGFDETAMFTEADSALETATIEAREATPTAGPAEEACSSADNASSREHPNDALKALQARHVLDRARSHAALLESYRSRFRNISRVLDCVGCEKCRLWGKLQFLGLGTATKVIFADAEARAIETVIQGAAARHPHPPPGARTVAVHLSRNEAVALINVFHRLALSVDAVGKFRSALSIADADDAARTEESGEGGMSRIAAAATEETERDVSDTPPEGAPLKVGATYALPLSPGPLTALVVVFGSILVSRHCQRRGQ